MGDLVKEAIELFDEKSDQELMERYARHIVGPFPPSVETKAILHIFGERNIQYQGIEIAAKFLHIKSRVVEKIYLKSGG